ncbi:hypothetical protein S1OALGB6SA_698 [Olavius algarvensis spirochete endosymbiont]|uniref:ribosome maturation factor RimM n=1 Tax=Olavius algarvensis spirochete endosymbiont TaxID=260710 RepID=UPI000F1C2851|nr:ribosome maturation factor RimM [Olavius algarvensis spirochete endosymbiont]VDA99627.1 hypothetical protein S1OALGB6SA_698 [Olavius algarvensis spirochete endosymbiont]
MDLIVIGTIRTTRGVKGWLKLRSFSGEWDHFYEIKTLVLRSKNHKRQKTYQVEKFEIKHRVGTIKLLGIDTPEDGKSLTGYEILVPRHQGARLKENQWYLCDLVGLRVLDTEGRALGEVISVTETSDDILEIRRPGGGNFMIPFRSNFVQEPNLENRTIVLTTDWLQN